MGDLSRIFFCEDHFNLEKDIENYQMHKMGFCKRLLVVKEAVPSKLGDGRQRMPDTSFSQPAYPKRQRRSEEIDEAPITTEARAEPTLKAQICVQCATREKIYFRSKAVQTEFPKKDVSVSPFKCSTTSSYTSPFNIEPCYVKPSKNSIDAIKRRIGFIDKEQSDSDVSSQTEGAKEDSSSSAGPSSSKISDSSTSISDTNTDIDRAKCPRHNILESIAKYPLYYIGVPKDRYYLVPMIHQHTYIPLEHMLLCWMKIRLNRTLFELGHEFGLSSYCSKLFLKNIPIIADGLKLLIVKLDRQAIRRTLAIPFRHNYYNVTCIIDCLVIDIQKPSKALHQAETWSDYKKANTVKYLISCTPNGLVNYISTGFGVGGRASDVTVLENCNFLDGLQPGDCILADRGLKHVEEVLHAKGIKFLRPPNVPSGWKLSKEQVRQTKSIASLRIHVEHVIRTYHTGLSY